MADEAGAARRFGRNRRLGTKREFDLVFREAQLRLRRGPLWLAARGNGKGVSRLGLVVGKKVLRKAVLRNRARRVIRESFRAQESLPAVDVVVRVTAPRIDRAHADLLFAALARVLARRAERDRA